MSSAITDLIAAARASTTCLRDGKIMELSDLADAAEKELEARNADLRAFETELYKAAQIKLADSLRPRTDLEALRKALTVYFSPHLPYKEWAASVDQLRALLAQLEGAKRAEAPKGWRASFTESQVAELDRLQKLGGYAKRGDVVAAGLTVLEEVLDGAKRDESEAWLQAGEPVSGMLIGEALEDVCSPEEALRRVESDKALLAELKRPKPEAQTCPTCEGYGVIREPMRGRAYHCDTCNGTGKVGGGK